MLITSSDIVRMCSKLGALSPNQAGLQPSDFIDLSNLVMTVLVSELHASREEYLIWQEALPVNVGQARYRIPPRALNSTLRHLWYEDATGTRSRLWTKTHEDLEGYNGNQQGTPTAFMIQGNDIVLLPTPNAKASLVVAYPFRPNLLVDGTTCQSIITVGTTGVTVGNIPPNFQNNMKYDIIDNLSGNGIIAYDLVGSVNPGNRTISFPSAPPSTVKPGQWIALAGQSPVPMIPEEGHPLLLETTVLRCEMLRGNKPRIVNSSAIVQDARKSWDSLLLGRVISKPIPTGNGGAQFPVRPW